MIIGMLALFVALTGTAVATTSALITGAQIKNNSITGADIKNKSVPANKLKGNFRGARGAAGSPGPVGPQGPKGDTGPAGAPNPNAENADKLDGRDSTSFLLGSGSKNQSFVNITGCDSGVLTSYAVNVTQPSRIFGQAVVSGFGNIGGSHSATATIQLLNAASTAVANSNRASTGTPNNQTSIATGGILYSGSTPYEVVPGSYTLRLQGDNFGACDGPAGYVQYQGIVLSHFLIPS